MSRDEAARSEKLRQLKKNQQRWMRERQAASDVQSVKGTYSSSNDENVNNSNNSNKNINNSSHRSTERDDNILNKITEKITDRLRDELKVELRQSNSLQPSNQKDLADHLENYLSSELHTHTCQICFELMMPPDKSPTLLFPCGHTFCKFCVERNDETSRESKCPYCRAKISSRAENHSLKQLIERFAGQKEKLESGEVRAQLK